MYTRVGFPTALATVDISAPEKTPKKEKTTWTTRRFNVWSVG